MGLPTYYNLLDTARGDFVLNAAALAAIMGGSPTAIVDTIPSTNPATTRVGYNQAVLSYAGAVTAGNGSGSIVGTRGEINVGNAATVLGAGYYFGTQGKVTSVASGTVGAGARAFGLVGQFDLSLGSVTGNPQISAVWGDMGATSPGSGWGTSSSILSGQNTTAAAVNSHTYTYGKATYWTEIEQNGSTFYRAAGTSGGSAGDAAHCAAQKVLTCYIEGAAAYIPVFTQNT